MGPVAAVDCVLGEYRLHRSRNEEKASLVFGNAAKLGDETERLKARISMFRAHIKQQLGLDLPPRLVSFSIQKQAFVVEALQESRYTRRLAIGRAHATAFWYTLKHSPELSVTFKSCVMLWAVLVVILPRAVAQPLARYVSNAASR